MLSTTTVCSAISYSSSLVEYSTNSYSPKYSGSGRRITTFSRRTPPSHSKDLFQWLRYHSTRYQYCTSSIMYRYCTCTRKVNCSIGVVVVGPSFMYLSTITIKLLFEIPHIKTRKPCFGSTLFAHLGATVIWFGFSLQIQII